MLYYQPSERITNALLYQLSYPGVLISKAFLLLRCGNSTSCVAFCASFWSCAVQNMAQTYYMRLAGCLAGSSGETECAFLTAGLALAWCTRGRINCLSEKAHSHEVILDYG